MGRLAAAVPGPSPLLGCPSRNLEPLRCAGPTSFGFRVVAPDRLNMLVSRCSPRGWLEAPPGGRSGPSPPESPASSLDEHRSARRSSCRLRRLHGSDPRVGRSGNEPERQNTALGRTASSQHRDRVARGRTRHQGRPPESDCARAPTRAMCMPGERVDPALNDGARIGAPPSYRSCPNVSACVPSWPEGNVAR